MAYDLTLVHAQEREETIHRWVSTLLLVLALGAMSLAWAYPVHGEELPAALGDGITVYAETPMADEEVTVRVPTGFVLANAGTNQANERVIVRAPKAESVQIRWDSQNGEGGKSSGPPNLLGRFERIMTHLGPGKVEVHVTVTYPGNRTKKVEKQFEVQGHEDPTID